MRRKNVPLTRFTSHSSPSRRGASTYSRPATAPSSTSPAAWSSVYGVVSNMRSASRRPCGDARSVPSSPVLKKYGIATDTWTPVPIVSA